MRRGLDRRALGHLGLGHLCVDFCQGAVPALLPFLAVERGYSYTALGALVLASTIGASILQPLFGILSDRFARPVLLPVALLLAGIGIALAGIAPSYGWLCAAIAVSGVGVAAYHPEGAKFAGIASRGRPGQGMSLFAVGGNAGFALGPLFATPVILLLGLPGTLVLVVPVAVAAALIALELPRLRELERAAAAHRGTSEPPAEDDWHAFSRLGVLITLRSGIYFGLQAFVPAYFVAELGSSATAGNAALTIMLVAGAAGTLVGGFVADRWGPKAVMVGGMVLTLPVLVALPFAGPQLATLLLGATGFFAIASFSVTVILGHAYLPSRMGLASGLTLGLAIGLGGVAALILGLVADAAGLTTVLWIIAVLPVPTALMALTLPTASRRHGRREAPSLPGTPPARSSDRAVSS